ncbi:MAG: helix-turn-helix transcriptional regulator [Patescibacteria group bacterium]
MRARRLELEMTQQQLAEATGLYQPDISEFEAGRKEPSLKTISIIAKGLRIPPEAMLLHDLVPV